MWGFLKWALEVDQLGGNEAKLIGGQMEETEATKKPRRL